MQASSLKPFSTDPAHLSALVTTISDAVKVVVAEYAAVGQVVPSLDSTQPGPLDAPENVSLGLSKAIRVIEAACAQLSFTVASPGHVVTNVSLLCIFLVSSATDLLPPEMLRGKYKVSRSPYELEAHRCLSSRNLHACSSFATLG